MSGFATIKKIPTAIYSAFKRAIHTKTALYIMFAIALANLYVMLFANDLASLLIFLCAGLMTSVYSTNMVIVLGVAIITVNVVKCARRKYRLSEGFNDDGDETDDNDDSDVDTKQNNTAGIESLLAGVDSNNGDNSTRIEQFKNSYEELMKLQDEIVEGLTRVNKPLEKAESIVSNLKESMSGFNF